MKATEDRQRHNASEKGTTEKGAPVDHAGASASRREAQPPAVRRYLVGLQMPLHLEGRLPGGHTLEHSFTLHDLVEHRGEPALICTCPRGSRRRFLLRYLDAVTEAASGETSYDPEAWFRTLLAQLLPSARL